MSILIKGMEMPTSCGQCPLHDEDYRGKEHCDIGWKMIGKSEEKPDWCPLVPVPPHGRLIDADALAGLFRAKVAGEKGLGPLMVNLAALCIDNAPTIIPAEEGE